MRRDRGESRHSSSIYLSPLTIWVRLSGLLRHPWTKTITEEKREGCNYPQTHGYKQKDWHPLTKQLLKRRRVPVIGPQYDYYEMMHLNRQIKQYLIWCSLNNTLISYCAYDKILIESITKINYSNDFNAKSLYHYLNKYKIKHLNNRNYQQLLMMMSVGNRN